MAVNDNKNIPDASASELRSDPTPFSDGISEQNSKTNPTVSKDRMKLPESDVSVGDKDLYGLSIDSLRDNIPLKALFARRSSQGFVRDSRFSWLQKAIAVTIIIVATMLMYALLKSPTRPIVDSPPTPTQEVVTEIPPSPVSPPLSQAPVIETPPVKSEHIQEPLPELLPTQPRSIEVARSFYMQGDYRRAYATYGQLLPALPVSEQFLRDYLQLEMALCAKDASDLAQASQLLSTISHSRSPIVRIMANYHLGLIELQRKRFLRARTRIYDALAILKAIDLNDDWASSFEADCHFMVAESLSRRVLSLSREDTSLPDHLWSNTSVTYRPFDQFGGIELQRFLRSGSEEMDKALLGPIIREREYPTGPSRWSVISYGSPLEELMSRFATAANLDIHWAIKGSSELVSAEDAARQRAVTLYLPVATPSQVVLVAAGCAGLMAYVEDNPDRLKVTIYDPIEYSSLDEYVSLMGQQAVSLWQKFVLVFYNDSRLGNAHFAMGLLQTRLGQTTEALAEYKLVTNRFSEKSLVPYALLHSSQIRIHLRDYHGARADLNQLIDQYPDTDIYEKAYWYLADATMEARLMAEAARLYQRVYNVGFSVESKTLSAFKAAKCLYETQAYEEAAKWLNRYINLVGEDKGYDVYSAYYLLGQTYLALEKYQQAYRAFQNILVEESPRAQYVQAITALVQSHIENEHFVEALNTLENLRSVTLSEEQSVETLLLRSNVYRKLGLFDEAIIFLQDRAGYVSDQQLDARISFELALCYIDKDDLENARNCLSEMLGVVESGPLAHEAAQILSDICVKLDQDDQAISVCLKLLDSDPPKEVKQNALKTLAAAYRERSEYDKAVLALSGQWK
ncbi:MAG: tetratricopeptide repeat protein [Sedimentisphaerales bacterium]|nr:tetratricopeptide repeat protein [Sedimentisphaerales bacterium]